MPFFRNTLLAALVLALSAALLSGCGALPNAAAAAPALPLHTAAVAGRMRIVDAHGVPVRLRSVNWFGAESATFVVGGLDRQPLARIVALIRAGGFNAVRLPWSNEMLTATAIPPASLRANPALAGKTPLQVFDIVIDELARNGLLVVIDNHRTRGDWCCDEAHGDGLWHDRAHTEADWLRDWAFMAARYRATPAVVGAELRNEIRPDPALGLRPSWGDGVAATDWRLAAQRGADVVSAANPSLLVIVGGIDWQTDLSAIGRQPLRIGARDKLVYAAHDYTWHRSAAELADDAAFARRSFERFGYLQVAGNDYSAPVYISEWGSCLQRDAAGQPCAADRVAFREAFRRYLAASGIDFAYWPLNGDQSPGYGRQAGSVEPYGLLTPDWAAYALPGFAQDLNR